MLSVLTASAEVRVWTDTQGRELEAELLELMPDAVKVRRSSDFIIVDIPLDLLSEADRNWVREARQRAREKAERERLAAEALESTSSRDQQATGPARGLSPDSLVSNGDFERGTTGWRGNRRVVNEGDNKVLRMDLHRRNLQAFTQDISVPNMTTVRLSMWVKPSEDYDSEGITLRFRRLPNGGSIYSSRSVSTESRWQRMTWDFDQIRGARSLTFEVESKAGSGYLLFDDIEIVDISR